jgi:ribosomal protein S18 acetylase RimI-like enzyme
MELARPLRSLEGLMHAAGSVEVARAQKHVHGGATLANREVHHVRLFRPQPRITIANRSDAPALTTLYTRVWDACAGQLDERLIADRSPSAEDVEAWLNGGFEVYTASMDGRLAGAVRCSFPTGTCLLDRLAVAPEFRRRGIGRALAEHAISRARRAGVTKVWLDSTPKLQDATALYQGLGFKESGFLRAHYWGEDVVLMELPL